MVLFFFFFGASMDMHPSMLLLILPAIPVVEGFVFVEETIFLSFVVKD